ncbi:unnamed protein product, partial [Plutella xylostella]
SGAVFDDPLREGADFSADLRVEVVPAQVVPAPGADAHHHVPVKHHRTASVPAARARALHRNAAQHVVHDLIRAVPFSASLMVEHPDFYLFQCFRCFGDNSDKGTLVPAARSRALRRHAAQHVVHDLISAVPFSASLLVEHPDCYLFQRFRSFGVNSDG